MLPLLALVLALAQPPAAYVDTGSAHVPLAVSSWCSGTRCGAPIAASKRPAVVRRGALVRVVLQFTPTRATLTIGGAPVSVQSSGAEIAWRATQGGGLTLRATSRDGWVTYVGRLVVRG